MYFRKLFTACSLLAATLATQAAQISRVTPQGEVARIRQVVVQFDAAAVTFGDPKAAAPASVQCSHIQASQGTGRWTSAREWVYDFAADLPPGVRCTVQPALGIKSTPSAYSIGANSYKFNSGGPFVQSIQPYEGSRIDEEQFFILQLNGAATLASLQASTWCAVEGLGERVAVRLVDGKDRAALLKAQGLDKAAAQDPLAIATLACNRRLPPAARVQLVYGKGVATPSGVANTVVQRFGY